jgi:hypothetical protein
MCGWRFKLHLSFEMFGNCRVALAVASGGPRWHRRPLINVAYGLHHGSKPIGYNSSSNWIAPRIHHKLTAMPPA